jgi:hypothetical protein
MKTVGITRDRQSMHQSLKLAPARIEGGRTIGKIAMRS